MPAFMIVASYSPEGLRGLRKDSAAGRKVAVANALESMGAKLKAVYFTLGDHDVVLIADFPNTVSVAGFSLVVSAAGFVRTQTTALLTVEEMDRALNIKADYRPPGVAPVPIAQF